MNYILHMHNHAGWFTQHVNAKNIVAAITEGLNKRAGFLSKKFDGKYKVEHDNPLDDHPRFRVVWDDDEPKLFPFGQRSLAKGDLWWSDRFQIGKSEDCESCGGTGISHYNPFDDCWSCHGYKTKSAAA